MKKFPALLCCLLLVLSSAVKAQTPPLSDTVMGNTNPCSGVPTCYTLSGNHSGLGISFQWYQSSVSANGPWALTNLADTNASYCTVLGQSGPTWITCVITYTILASTDTALAIMVIPQAYSALSPCYCASNATITSTGDIGQISLGSLNNPTLAPPLINNVGSPTGYSNFDTLRLIPNLIVGQTYSLSVLAKFFQTTTQNGWAKAWLDFDHNTIWDSQEIILSSAVSAPNYNTTSNFTIPTTALSGSARLRVVYNIQGTAANTAACGTYNYGETEDYIVTILDPGAFDPAVTNIQVTPSNSCLDNNETVVVTLGNFGSQILDPMIDSFKVTLHIHGPSGLTSYTQAYSGPFTQQLAPFNNNSGFMIFNGLNLYEGGCYDMNTEILTTSASGNTNAVNDSLFSAFTICNTRPNNGGDYNLCLGDTIPAGQGLSITNCPSNYIKDSVLIPFNLSFSGNYPPNPTQCAAQGAGSFATGVLPYLPLGSNILNGELKVTNLSLTGWTFPTNFSLTRFSLYEGSLPTTAANIFYPGTVGGTPTGFGCLDYVSSPNATDLNKMYVNGVPLPANGAVRMGHWSTNYCTASSFLTNCTNQTIATLKIVYEYIPTEVSWFEQPSGGISISHASVFNPLQTPNSIISHSNTPGTYTFYGACAADTNCRVASSLTLSGVQFSSVITTDVLCKGDSTGSISITSAGGAGLVSYSITPNAGAQASSGTFTGLPAGTYTVYGTDANGCSAATTINIYEPANKIQITNVTSTIPSCVPGNDATMTINVTGGTPAYQFSNGLNIQPSNVFSNQGAGVYTITVTDANGCSETTTTLVPSPAAPAWAFHFSDNVSCHGGSDGAIQASVIPGNSPTISTTIILPIAYASNSLPAYNLPAGSYTIQAVDGNGCAIITVVNINEPPSLNLDTLSTIRPTCNSNIYGAIQISASGGTGANAFSILPNTGQQLPTGNFTNLPGGSYTITVTDANACTATKLVSLNPISNINSISSAINPPTCKGDSNGSISITAAGSGPLNYSIVYPAWAMQNNANGLFSNLPSGNYSVSISDTTNCTKTVDFNIPQGGVQIGIPQSSNLPCADSSGIIQMNSTSANGNIVYTLVPTIGIQSSSGIFSNLPNGTYTITATDANACTATTLVTLNFPSRPQITNTQKTNVDCFGAMTGSISVSATGGSGGHSFLLAPVSLQNSSGYFNNLAAGVYEVTVTDFNNCTASTQITLAEPPPLTFTASTRNATCANANNGGMIVYPQGGTPSYQFTYHNGIPTSTASNFNLSPGTIHVAVIDSLGCRADNHFTIYSDSMELKISARINESCLPGADGILGVYGLPTDTSYVYSIDSSSWQNSGEFKNLNYGDYKTYVLHPSSGCVSSRTDSIRFKNDLPLHEVVVSHEICFGEKNGRVVFPDNQNVYNLIPSAGTINTPGEINNIAPGIYTLIGKQANGCSGEKVIEISAADSLWIAFERTNASNIHCYGSVNFEAIGGAGNFSYDLKPSAGRNVSPGFYDGLCWGDYTLSATDKAGCVRTKKISIDEDLNAPRNMFHHFKVYPNPAQDQIWFESAYLFPYEVSLLNMAGQCTATKNIHDKKASLDVSNLAPGVYILRFKSDVDRFERKVVIQR